MASAVRFTTVTSAAKAAAAIGWAQIVSSARNVAWAASRGHTGSGVAATIGAGVGAIAARDGADSGDASACIIAVGGAEAAAGSRI